MSSRARAWLIAAGLAVAALGAVLAVRGCAAQEGRDDIAGARRQVVPAAPEGLGGGTIRYSPPAGTPPGTETEPASTVVVRGIVRDRDRSPVAGARVAVDGLRTVSGKDGAFEVKLPPVPGQRGAVSIRTVHPRYRSKDTRLPLRTAATAQVTVELERWESVRGIVIDSNGDTVAEAIVTVGENAVRTDSEGRFELPRPSIVPAVLQVSARGHVPRKVVVTPVGDDLVVRLDTGREITIRCVDEAGRGVEGAVVNCIEPATGEVFLVRTDAQGVAPLEGISPRGRVVQALARGFAPTSFEVPAGLIPVLVELTLRRGSPVSVSVETQQPVGEMAWEMRLLDLAIGEVVSGAKSDDSGTVSLNGAVGDGEYAILARPATGASQDGDSRWVVVRSRYQPATDGYSLAWVAPRLSRVSLEVRDGGGGIVAGARVALLVAAQERPNPFNAKGTGALDRWTTYPTAGLATTSAEGEATVWVELGTYRVSVREFHIRSPAEPIEVPRDQPVRVIVDGGHTVRGSIATAEGWPIPGAAVQFMAQTEKGGARIVQADGEGTFEITGLSAGLYTVIGEGFYHEPDAIEVQDVRIPNESQINLKVQTFTVRGRVVGGDAGPKLVRLLYGGGKPGGVDFVSDSEGRFVIDGVSRRPWGLAAGDEVAHGDWYGPVDRDTEVIINLSKD